MPTRVRPTMWPLFQLQRSIECPAGGCRTGSEKTSGWTGANQE